MAVLLPYIGRQQVASITPAELLKMMRGIEARGDVGIGLEAIAHAGPAEGGALDPLIGLVAGSAVFDQCEQDAAGKDGVAGAVEVAFHGGGVDDEAVDHAGGAAQCEVQDGGGVGGDHALDAAVADVALVPQGDVFEGGGGVAAQETTEAGEVFRRSQRWC